MMLATMLMLEFRKLRGTLALGLCIVAPALVAVVALAIALRQPSSWTGLLTNTLGLWAYFVMPLTISALAALIAQVEHGPLMWDHLFALPISRARLVVAKALALMLLIGGMSALLVGLCFVLGALAHQIAPARGPSGAFPAAQAAAFALSTWAASALAAVLQLWVALVFRSFVAPVALGLAGTFLVVSAMGAPESLLLPWAMPLGTLGLPGGNPALALAAGFLGGLLLMPVMAAHLARRDFS